MEKAQSVEIIPQIRTLLANTVPVFSRTSVIIICTNNIFFFLPGVGPKFTKLFFVLIGLLFLYNVVLVSAIQQLESAVCIHIVPPS